MAECADIYDVGGFSYILNAVSRGTMILFFAFQNEPANERSIVLKLTTDGLYLVGRWRFGWQNRGTRQLLTGFADWRTAMPEEWLSPEEIAFGTDIAAAVSAHDPRPTLPFIAPRADYIRRYVDQIEE